MLVGVISPKGNSGIVRQGGPHRHPCVNAEGEFIKISASIYNYEFAPECFNPKAAKLIRLVVMESTLNCP